MALWHWIMQCSPTGINGGGGYLELRVNLGLQSILLLKIAPLNSSVRTILRSRHSVSRKRNAWLCLGLATWIKDKMGP
ncbi:unnamed protein product [Fusarium graminearum]|nr:unnamed protein product [Fusarium graminearum]CAG1974330.1 unnamed protein product [Fusarium graminearum]